MFALSPTTLIGRLAPAARLPDAVRFVLLALAGSAFVAVSAQITVPLWPVPVTGQTLAVLVVGMAYGARLGASTMALYLLEGSVGLPVFAAFAAGPAVLAGPTGGYLVGFVVAAGLVGWLAERRWSRTPWGSAGAMVLGNLAIYAFGVAWLTLFFAGPGVSRIAAAGAETALEAAVVTGLLPFLVGDGLKIVLAACLMPAAWWLVGPVRR